MVLNNLEIDRARKEAAVDRVVSLIQYQQKARELLGAATQIDILDILFREHRIRSLEVPTTTWASVVDQLRQRKYRVTLKPKPFFPQRFIKTRAEKGAIDAAQRAVFRAYRQTEKILRASQIRRGYLYYRGKILAAEWLRAELSSQLYHQGYVTTETLIIAGGNDGVDPHCRGDGPLRPHQAIVCDYTPMCLKTHFYGDATRTFCRGAASPALKRQYATVLRAQELGIRLVRAGMNGRIIHTAIVKYFESQGYHTGPRGGRMQGFFHTTGHGIGLEVHEEPQRIAPSDYILQEGMVVSIEPGLYYSTTGGVRIEDLVYVTKTGCDILGGHYPKRLEIL